MMKIVRLEDNERRQTVMADCLRDRFHQFEQIFFDDAASMVTYLGSNLCNTLLISLDHDLPLRETQHGKFVDAGTGREVAEVLAALPPTYPVVIHTSNSACGDAMEFLLREAHWETHRVHPFGDLEWISTQWFRTVRNAIVSSARPCQKK